jgi:hypothetical protein
MTPPIRVPHRPNSDVRTDVIHLGDRRTELAAEDDGRVRAAMRQPGQVVRRGAQHANRLGTLRRRGAFGAAPAQALPSAFCVLLSATDPPCRAHECAEARQLPRAQLCEILVPHTLPQWYPY